MPHTRKTHGRLLRQIGIAFVGLTVGVLGDDLPHLYRLSVDQGDALHRSYDKYSKAKAAADAAWTEYTNLRADITGKIAPSGRWCASPDKTFTFLIREPGCGD